LNLGYAAPNGLSAYDTTNKIIWDRVNDIWVPRAGQVVYQAGEAGYFGETADREIFSYVLPANFLHATGGLEIQCWGRFEGATAATMAISFLIGGVVQMKDTTASLASGVAPWHFTVQIRNVGATNVNRMNMIVIINALGTATNGFGDIAVDEITAHGLLQANGTIDYTAARTLSMRIDPSAARDIYVNTAFARIVS
jgi:hypothetical protein